MKQFIIIADGGGTKTKAVAIADGAVAGRFTAGSCVPFLDLDGAVSQVRLVCDSLLASVNLGREDAAISLSLASAGLDSQAIAEEFKRRLCEIVDSLLLASDGEAALEACCGTAPGAVIAIGTGVAVSARTENDRLMMIDGWGWPAGDRGGGAWTGRHVVEHFLAANDRGVSSSDPFHVCLADVIGRSRDEILVWLRGASRALYASLAQDTVEWAIKGSPAARAAIMFAVAEIEATRTSLLSRGVGNVHITGGFGAALMPFLDQKNVRFIKDAPFQGARLRASRWLPTLQELEL